MKINKKHNYYYPIRIPDLVKIGDRYEIKVEQEYVDKTFKIGSKVTFIKLSKREFEKGIFYIFPYFKFDGDNKFRILEFSDLKRIE